MTFTFKDGTEVVGQYRPNPRARGGYGSAVPTAFVVRVGNRTYRVYCVRWANSGTLYIRRKGRSFLENVLR